MRLLIPPEGIFEFINMKCDITATGLRWLTDIFCHERENQHRRGRWRGREDMGVWEREREGGGAGE